MVKVLLKKLHKRKKELWLQLKSRRLDYRVLASSPTAATDCCVSLYCPLTLVYIVHSLWFILSTHSGLYCPLALVYIVHSLWFILSTRSGLYCPLALVYIVHSLWFILSTRSGLYCPLALVYIVHSLWFVPQKTLSHLNKITYFFLEIKMNWRIFSFIGTLCKIDIFKNWNNW